MLVELLRATFYTLPLIYLRTHKNYVAVEIHA